MKPFRLDQRMALHIGIASAWLGFLTIANQQASQPVVSIFPYLAPVVFFAWAHDAKWGFLFAGLATLAAIPSDYFNTHSQTDLFFAGFKTYAQLTGAAIGVVVAKRIHDRSGYS